MSVKVDDIAAVIADMLSEYQVEVTKNIDESGKTVAEKGAKELRKTSPKKTGAYAKGWKVTKNGGKNFGDSLSYVIHNKDHYRLTHLLENGHATRNGGRTRAIKHIEPAEQAVIKDYEAAVKEAIENAAK